MNATERGRRQRQKHAEFPCSAAALVMLFLILAPFFAIPGIVRVYRKH